MFFNVKKLIFSFLLTGLTIGGFSVSTVEAVKNTQNNGGVRFEVKPVEGVPRITKNDVPILPRIFWGNYISRQAISLKTELYHYEHDYTPTVDAEKKGTFHFRFGKEAGEFFIDNFSIVEKDTGKAIAGPYSFESEDEFTQNWSVWNDTKEGHNIAKVRVGKPQNHDSNAVLITIEDPPKDLAYDFHIHHNTNLDLKANKTYHIEFDIWASRPGDVMLGVYRPGDVYVSLGGDLTDTNVFLEQVKLARDVGGNIVSFYYPAHWIPQDGKWNWGRLDQICDQILKVNPNALLLPRVCVDAPDWWLKQNPDEKIGWKGEDRSAKVDCRWDSESVSSLKYRQTACQALAALIQHLEARYGDSVIGYHPCGQNTNEWFTINTWIQGFTGYGKADEISWRQWLREKYITDENLQKAWKDTSVTLDTVTVPQLELRQEALTQPKLDPNIDPRHQSLIDLNIWMQKEMTDTVLALGKTIRENTGNRKLSIFFYGYSFEFGTVAKGPAASAHYNLRALLDSPDIDIICSPVSYSERQRGGGCSCMVTGESVTAAGKMYLFEDDTRTYLSHETDHCYVKNQAETIDILKRNTGEAIIRDFATWWMDLGSIGWFNDPVLWDVMNQLKEMDEYFLTTPTPYRPEIGVFLDEGSMLKVSTGKNTTAMVSLLRQPLNRMGTPYGQYLLDDLLSGRVAAPKLCVVLNPNCLTDEQKVQIREKTKDSVLLWIDEKGGTREQLCEAAQKAGVHMFTQEVCNVWANGPYAVLHGAADGDVHFTANQGLAVYDGITGEKLSDTPQVVIPLKLGETRILKFF